MKQAIPFLRTNDPEYKELVLKKNKQKFRSNFIHGEMSPLGKTASMNFSPEKLSVSKHSRGHESGIPTSDLKHRVTNILKRREQNWQHYVLPISKLNEEWHKSKKITFEKI